MAPRSFPAAGYEFLAIAIGTGCCAIRPAVMVTFGWRVPILESVSWGPPRTILLKTTLLRETSLAFALSRPLCGMFFVETLLPATLPYSYRILLSITRL